MTKTPPLKCGLVGFGKLGMLHAAVANGLECSRLVAVADTSKFVLDALKENSPALSVYTDFDRMLDNEDLDAVFIASPTHLHVPMALECAKRGIPFLAEKPLATSGAACAPLLESLRARPITNMVGYMGRFIDTFARGKEVVDSGALGRIVHVRTSMYVSQLFKTGKGWRYDKSMSGGGVLITQNSHLIDLLQWYFGRFAWVSGHVKMWYSGSVDDLAHAYFEFENGVTGFLDTSWSARHHRMVDITVDIQGENGTLTVTDDFAKLFLDESEGNYRAGWTRWLKPDLYQPVEIDIGGPQYTRQNSTFLNAVLDGSAIECDVESAAHVQDVIDSIYVSSDRGGSKTVVRSEVPVGAE